MYHKSINKLQTQFRGTILNHPSGDSDPSQDDFEFTEFLSCRATFMDMRVHDQIIIGNNTYYRFAENGFYGKLNEKINNS